MLTQNYKAEYEKAAAAVITAVTKSGGNEFHGEVFYLYQDKDMVDAGRLRQGARRREADLRAQAVRPLARRPDHRGQAALLRLLPRATSATWSPSVFRGSSWDSAPANVRATLDGYETGTLSAPLDSKLYFGKLSWQPSIGADRLDCRYHRRDEEEIRGFGGQRVEEGAEDFQVDTDALVLRHQMVFGNALNEASLT